MSEDPTTRRGFFAGAGAFLCASVAILGPVVAGLGFLFTPLKKKKKPGTDDNPGEWVKVATLDMLQPGGPPKVFPVIREMRDGWTNHGMQPSGLVFLRREAATKVLAWSAICTHASCPVQFELAKEGFSCNCHGAAFDLAGQSLNDVAPRALDQLEAEVRNTSEVWVKFAKFQAGVAEKIPLA